MRFSCALLFLASFSLTYRSRSLFLKASNPTTDPVLLSTPTSDGLPDLRIRLRCALHTNRMAFLVGA